MIASAPAVFALTCSTDKRRDTPVQVNEVEHACLAGGEPSSTGLGKPRQRTLLVLMLSGAVANNSCCGHKEVHTSCIKQQEGPGSNSFYGCCARWNILFCFSFTARYIERFWIVTLVVSCLALRGNEGGGGGVGWGGRKR